MPAPGPDFRQPVTPGGYAWWYVDAIGDDGRHALTVIAFIGSVFSPYYARARRRATAEGRRVDPEDHVAINVALYGGRKRRWAMTERGRGALVRNRQQLSIGGSRWQMHDNGVDIHVHEHGAPWPARVAGHIRLTMPGWNPQAFELAPGTGHWWHPHAPRARVQVSFRNPSLDWQGDAYLDANCGPRPLAEDFRAWSWSRVGHDTATRIVYEIEPRRAPAHCLSLRHDAASGLTETPMEAPTELPGTLWRIRRRARGPARLVSTLEDTPFYARSQIATRLDGRDATGVHEQLDLDRLTTRWVPWLLPFRMPRLRGFA